MVRQQWNKLVSSKTYCHSNCFHDVIMWFCVLQECCWPSWWLLAPRDQVTSSSSMPRTCQRSPEQKWSAPFLSPFTGCTSHEALLWTIVSHWIERSLTGTQGKSWLNVPCDKNKSFSQNGCRSLSEFMHFLSCFTLLGSSWKNKTWICSHSINCQWSEK